MSLEDNKALIRDLVEAFNEHDLSSLLNLVSPDFIDHKRQVTGPEALKQNMTVVYEQFPDFHATLQTSLPKETRSGSLKNAR